MTEQCQAKTKTTGKQCSNSARPGSTFCGIHDDGANIGRRHTLETDEGRARVQKFFELLQAGIPIGAACDVVGLGESTVMLWRSQGEEAREKAAEGLQVSEREHVLIEFLEGFTRARGKSVQSLVLDIRKAAAGRDIRRKITRHNKDGSMEQEEEYFPADWRAADRLLVISHGFGTTKIEHSGPGGGPIKTESETKHDLSNIDFLEVGRIMGEIGALENLEGTENDSD